MNGPFQNLDIFSQILIATAFLFVIAWLAFILLRIYQIVTFANEKRIATMLDDAIKLEKLKEKIKQKLTFK